MSKAWVSMKSFLPKGSSDEGPRSGSGDPPQAGRNREADFRKTKRSNETHDSTTDTDAPAFIVKAPGRRAVFAILAMR